MFLQFWAVIWKTVQCLGYCSSWQLDLDSVVGKIALSVMQHQPLLWKILDARPMRWPLQSMTSAQCLGSLASHRFHWKAFALPRLSSKYWSNWRNLTLLGYSVSEVWVMATVLSSALMTPRLKSQTKRNCRTKTKSGSGATGNRILSHFLQERKKLFWKALSGLRFSNVNCAFL